MTTFSTTLNGQPVHDDVDASLLLVDWLRERRRLTGTHVGCDTSQCGACTVLVDGQAVKGCTMLAVQADGRALTTIEGLAGADALHPVQQAFADCHALQCGFCTPGMVLSAVALLREQPQPSDAAIVQALEGNLCRCTGYANIVRAVRQAAGAVS